MKLPKPNHDLPKRATRKRVKRGPTQAQVRETLDAIQNPFGRPIPPKALEIMRIGSATFTDCKERVCRHGGKEVFILKIGDRKFPFVAAFEVDANGMVVKNSQRLAYYSGKSSRMTDKQKHALKEVLTQMHAVYSTWRK